MKQLLPIVFLILCAQATVAQVDEDSELFRTLREKDSILFRAAFDTCDSDTLASLFTEDLEFYHDKGGLSEGRDVFMTPFRENCAKRDPQAPQASKRILIEGSLEVFPLYANGELYGAIQHGIHRFEFLNAEGQYQQGDIAKFTHVWVLKNGNWKVKRELSFDHQPYQSP